MVIRRIQNVKELDDIKDLALLIAGKDVINTRRKGLMLYEGNIGGKESFMRRANDNKAIYSWRAKREDITIENGLVDMARYNSFEICSYTKSGTDQLNEYDSRDKILKDVGM